MPRYRLARFESAVDFFQALSPATGISTGYVPNQTVYRGHGRAEVQLMPSAFRADKWHKWFEHFRGRNAHGFVWESRLCKEQIWCEFQLLIKFFEAADREGLRMPDDSQILRAEVEEWSSYFSRLFRAETRPGDPERLAAWPPRLFLSLMALAQHSRLPTRLLDWSWSPYVAAYFAAKSGLASDPNNPSEYICVWELSAAIFEFMRDLVPASRQGISLVTVPAADNANLRAQRGLFLLHRPRPGEIDPNKVFNCAPLEEKLDASLFRLTKLVLPTTEAPELLRLLACQGVHAGSVFPGFDGVVASMEERYATAGGWPSVDAWKSSAWPGQLQNHQETIKAKGQPD